MLSRIVLDPARQLVGAQCSGTLLLAKLGLIGNLPACTDLITKPWVIEAGVEVLDAPFVAHGNVATAGGCLASQYLAAWMIARMASLRDAEEIIRRLQGACATRLKGGALHGGTRRRAAGGAEGAR